MFLSIGAQKKRKKEYTFTDFHDPRTGSDGFTLLQEQQRQDNSEKINKAKGKVKTGLQVCRFLLAGGF